MDERQQHFKARELMGGLRTREDCNNYPNRPGKMPATWQGRRPPSGRSSGGRTWCSGSRSSRLRFLRASASSSTLASCTRRAAQAQCGDTGLHAAG